jgi:hypothetical protein
MSTPEPRPSCLNDSERRSKPLTDEQRERILTILRSSPTYPYRVVKPH